MIYNYQVQRNEILECLLINIWQDKSIIGKESFK